jgi:catechol 2,3-dioxygenase-like lactoylglutathione lyase family enzyme
LRLHMVEVRVRDWEISRRWYETLLGQAPTMLDELHQFALIDLPPVRLALKAGGCVPGSTMLSIETPDLNDTTARLAGSGIMPVEPPKISPEGYRRVIYADPDGQRIVVFQWLANGASS